MSLSLKIVNVFLALTGVLCVLIVIIAFNQPFRAAPIPFVAEHVDTPAIKAELNRGWYGFVLRLDGTHTIEQFKQSIDEIAAMNANSVLLETPLLEADPEAVELTIEGAQCPDLNDLVSVIDYANQKSLGVILVPTVVFEEVNASQSRARFAPADWGRWWISYERQILRLAELAQASKCEVFSVGSELSESEIMTSQWTSLLTQVRSRYPGLLMYNAQWERASKVSFWEYVDVIGVSAWFPIDESGDESAASLEAQWEKALREVDLLAAGQQRPIVLTAVGYPSLSTGAQEPWEANRKGDAVADENLQASALSAFLSRFEALDPQSPRHAGFFIYRWGAADEPDTDPISHVIEGKQAEKIVREALGRLTKRTPEH